MIVRAALASRPPSRDAARMALEHLVLGLVAGGVRHGYAIRRRIDDALGGRATVQSSHVYGALAALERDGLVAARAREEAGRRRRGFEATPAGAARLAAWLSSPPPDAAAVLRDPLLVELSVRALLDAPPSRREIAAERAARGGGRPPIAPDDGLARVLRDRTERRRAVALRLLDRVAPGGVPGSAATRSRPGSGSR